ncbi:LuxR family transcriptional regulator [Streptomyces fildesensis]|uniref:LuxR family transcriptional regulator n=1 Tax=Streptomyces fildesensis TaxID=375757 RepID=A0ABW8C4R3_9ACTN
MLIRANAHDEEFDGVERNLLQVRSLIDSTVSAHRSRGEKFIPAKAGADHGAANGAVMQLMGRAKDRASVTLSGDGVHAAEVAAALVRHGDTGDSGIIIRLLCTPKALDTPLVRLVAPRIRNCEIRVTEGDLDEALVVDGRIALVPAERDSGSGRGSVLEDLATARILELLLADAWRGAVPLTEYERLSGRMRTEVGRRVLERLYEGCTDVVAARELRVSLRTYRRHVAEIMRDLGASSRFQAGVRAAELRLLPDRR